jgi:hypothetical protein
MRLLFLLAPAALIAVLLLATPAGAACPETGCGGGDPPPAHPKTLHIDITGSGQVSNGGTVICSQPSCDVTFDSGDSVSLTGTGTNGQSFLGWSGDCSGTTCSLTMSVNRSVTATFHDITAPPAPNIGAPSQNQVIQSSSGGSTVIGFTNSGDATSDLCRMDTNSSSGATVCSSPWSTGNLSTGTHTAYVWAKDAAGNISAPASRSFKVVNLPETTLGGTPAQDAISGSPDTAFTYSSPTGTSFVCTLDGNTVPCDANLSPGEGAHTLSVKAGISPFGDNVVYYDSTPATRSFTVDTQAPDTSITGGPASATTDTTAALSFTGADPAPGTALSYECKLDGGAFEPCATGQSYSGLGLGSHTFSVRATDAAGNVDATPATRTWSVIADADGDGFFTPRDCNDGNPAIHPGATDVPGDGIDQDCSGADARRTVANDGPRSGATGPTAAQIRALLRRQMIARGKAARIKTLLKRKGASLAFRALVGGRAVVRWYYAPRGKKPVLVATGRRTFAAAGKGKLALKLTAKGRKLLARARRHHVKRVKLSARGSFTPLGGTAVTARRGFALKR